MKPNELKDGDAIEIKMPFDRHVHFRDGERLVSVVPYTAKHCTGAIVMPNIGVKGGKSHIYTSQDAREYHDQIMRALPDGSPFLPAMTLYLTDSMQPRQIVRAYEDGYVFGVKMYPANATTNSAEGVTDWRKRLECFRAMAEARIPLLVHGEKVNNTRGLVYWEGDFYEEFLPWIAKNVPTLQLSFEHITTTAVMQMLIMCEAGDLKNLPVGTITPQHIMYTMNDLLASGCVPDLYCKPILKLPEQIESFSRKLAFLRLARIAMGTDSAPHLKDDKYCECGCAGCFSAPHMVSMYANQLVGTSLVNPSELAQFNAFMATDNLDIYPGLEAVLRKRNAPQRTLTLVWRDKVPKPHPVEVWENRTTLKHIVPMPDKFEGKPGWIVEQ